MTHHPDVSTKEIGANIYYAQNDGTIEIGDEGTTTKSWVIAAKPDLISAKRGGKVKIKSTHNMLVGSVDMVQKPDGLEDIPNIKAGSVTGTFSGEDSYWFGDEQSFNNISKEIVDKLKKFGGEDVANSIDKILSAEEFEFTFQNGAQWTYLDAFNVDASKFHPLLSGPLFENKRISKITLLDGGIINLFDKDILEKLTKIGLWNLLDIDKNTLHHDYVRIGDLKGNNGIFRLDLNSDDRTQSDMIFIEGASEGRGLGLRFLRHIERNSLLLFMVPGDTDNIGREYEILLNELKQFNPGMLDKHRVLAVTKSDLLDEELMEMLRADLPKDLPVVYISAVTGYGLQELKDILWEELNKESNKIEDIVHRPKDVTRLQQELKDMGEDEELDYEYEEDADDEDDDLDYEYEEEDWEEK